MARRLVTQNVVPTAEQPPMVLLDLGMLGKNSERWNAEGTAGAEYILPIRLCRGSVLCGPLYRPATGHGPCPACLEQRWRRARHPDEQRALGNVERGLFAGASPKLTPFALDTIWGLISTLIERHAEIMENDQAGTFYELHLDTLQVTQRQLVADSLCPVCATPTPDTAEQAVVTLQSRPKGEREIYRLTAPMDYPLPLNGYLNPICGVFGSQPFPDYTSTVTAPVSGSFIAESKFNPFEAWWGGHATTYQRSERIGLLEALERYSGLRPRAKQVTVFDSYQNIRDHALNPLDCGVYEPEYYEQSGPHAAPFTPERKLYWVWGYSFRLQRPILVPEELVYYLEYHPDVPHFVKECSNGCATGSTLEEAMLFGLLELIERDAFLMTWYARLAPPRIDPASCRKPATIHMLNRIDRLGYDVALFDTRMDIPVPSVTAVARRRDDALGQLVLAAGAGFDPEEAIRSAICEIGSYLPDFVNRTQDRLDELRDMARDYTKVTRIDHHAPLYGLPEMRHQTDFMYRNSRMESIAIRYADWADMRPQSLDLSEDLRYVVNVILDRGLDVIVVDQTAPEAEKVGIKVVSTIVPGLLPMEFGYDRRRYRDLTRLRTVPRTAGYMEHDFDPAHANTVPHPFP
jgi:ribosomal protein S12 methylthiotransferase accessory factor